MSLAFKHEASRETLMRELEANRTRIEALKERNEELQERIAALEPPAPAPLSRKGSAGPQEAFRDAVVKTPAFTISELAAHLAWSPARVRKHVAEWIEQERMRDTGKRFGGQKIYEYVPPTDEGAGFRQDQKFRPIAPELPSDLIERVAIQGTGGKPLYQEIAAKDVREAVREAIGHGWTLHRKSDGHFTLVRGEVRVGVPKTPQNASTAARRIRRQVAGGKGVGMTSRPS